MAGRQADRGFSITFLCRRHIKSKRDGVNGRGGCVLIPCMRDKARQTVTRATADGKVIFLST